MAGTMIRAEGFPAGYGSISGNWGLKSLAPELQYRREDLVGRRAVNFPKQVADFISECLTTGFVTDEGDTRSPSGK